MSTMRLINERDIGTHKMTRELEEAYLASCELHNTTPDDLEYFRDYIWNIIAMIFIQMKKGTPNE